MPLAFLLSKPSFSVPMPLYCCGMSSLSCMVYELSQLSPVLTWITSSASQHKSSLVLSLNQLLERMCRIKTRIYPISKHTQSYLAFSTLISIGAVILWIISSILSHVSLTALLVEETFILVLSSVWRMMVESSVLA
jgi:hypothetical protein